MKFPSVPLEFFAAAFAVASGLVVVFSTYGFPIDDSYITARYAENLAAGNGLSFNAGETSFGASSILWALVLAAAKISTGADLVQVSRVLGVLFFALSAVLVFRMVAGKTDELCGLLASLLFASSIPLLFTAASGMESMLYILLLLSIAYVVLLHGFEKPGRLGLLCGLLFLARPDGLLAFALVFAALALKAIQSARNLGIAFSASLKMLAAFALVVLPWILFVYANTGNFLPTTLYGKILNLTPAVLTMHPLQKLSVGLDIALESAKYALFYSYFAFAALFAFGAAETYRKLRESRLDERDFAFAVFVFGFVFLLPLLYGFLFPAIPDMGGVFGRYILPILPLVFVGGVIGLHAIISAVSGFSKFHEEARKVFSKPAVLAALFAALAVSGFLFPVFNFPGFGSVNDRYFALVATSEDVRRAAGEWVLKNTDERVRIATDAPGLGAIGYYANRYVADMGGLINPDLWPFYQKKIPPQAAPLDFWKFQSGWKDRPDRLDEKVEYYQFKGVSLVVTGLELDGDPRFERVAMFESQKSERKFGTIYQIGIYRFLG